MSSTNENPSRAYVRKLSAIMPIGRTIREPPGRIFGWINMDSHDFIKSKSFLSKFEFKVAKFC